MSFVNEAYTSIKNNSAKLFGFLGLATLGIFSAGCSDKPKEVYEEPQQTKLEIYLEKESDVMFNKARIRDREFELTSGSKKTVYSETFFDGKLYSTRVDTWVKKDGLYDFKVYFDGDASGKLGDSVLDLYVEGKMNDLAVFGTEPGQTTESLRISTIDISYENNDTGENWIFLRPSVENVSESEIYDKFQEKLSNKSKDMNSEIDRVVNSVYAKMHGYVVPAKTWESWKISGEYVLGELHTGKTISIADYDRSGKIGDFPYEFEITSGSVEGYEGLTIPGQDSASIRQSSPLFEEDFYKNSGSKIDSAICEKTGDLLKQANEVYNKVMADRIKKAN